MEEEAAFLEGHPLQVPSDFKQAKKNAEHQSSNRGQQQHIVLKVIHTCLQVICFFLVLQLEDMLLPLEKFTPEHLQGHQRLVSVRQPTFTHAKEASGVICCLHICKTLNAIKSKI